MTWLEEITNALRALGGDAHYSDLYEHIRNTTSRRLPRTWKAVIRATIEAHSSDAQFTSGKDIFYSVAGIGSGHWGLRTMRHAKDATQAIDVEEPAEPKRTRVEAIRIVRDTDLTRDLKKLYRNKCQVCGETVSLVDRDYSEVHHLQPLGGTHRGPDVQSNMLVLCPNHHAQFDYGALAVDPSTLVVLHPDGQKIGRITLLPGHNLGEQFLSYHLEQVYLKASMQQTNS